MLPSDWLKMGRRPVGIIITNLETALATWKTQYHLGSHLETTPANGIFKVGNCFQLENISKLATEIEIELKVGGQTNGRWSTRVR